MLYLHCFLHSVPLTQWHGSVCYPSDRIRYTSNKDIQLMGVSYAPVCLCSEVWDYEIIGSESGLARAKRSYGMDGKGNQRHGGGKGNETKSHQAASSCRKGQGNTNRVRRLNWQSEVRLKSQEREGRGRGRWANSRQSHCLHAAPVGCERVHIGACAHFPASHGSPVSPRSRWALHF